MSNEGEGPAMTWVREYNAQLLTLDDLAKRIANHKFKEREGSSAVPTPARALEYKDADYQGGTFDDVYRARAFGLLTRGDMEVILERVKQARAAKANEEPARVCKTAASPDKAEVIELRASSEPHLVKVDDGYIRVKVTR